MTKKPIRTSDDLPRDHWIARQLPAGTSLRSFAEDEAISTITSAVQDAIDKAGLTRAEIARLLGTTKSYISQVLNGSTNMTLRTLGALLWATGREVAELRTEELGAPIRSTVYDSYGAYHRTTVPQSFTRPFAEPLEWRGSAAVSLGVV